MRKLINKDDFINSLHSAGIKEGDCILVHSNISALGMWEELYQDNILENIKQCILEVLGEKGTLCVPAYFYEYVRNATPFDIKHTPPSKELGVFSNYIFSDENVKRSINPLTSICAIGDKSEFIVGGKTGQSYGFDTPWDRLMKVNAKMVFIGIDLRSMTFIHHCEHAMCVPHLYQKLFTTKVYNDKEEINIPICSQVRYLDFNIAYRTDELTRIFENNGLATKSNIGRGSVRVVDFNECFEFLCNNLKSDLFYLLKSAPTFVNGQIPLR